MVRKLIYLFWLDSDPDLAHLRVVTTVFFLLWIINVTAAIYSGCLAVLINTFVTLNTWLVISATVFSCNYCRTISGQSSFLRNWETGSLSHKDSPLRRDIRSDEHALEVSLEGTSGFCFAMRRLHTLISFSAAIFVIFGCLTTLCELVESMVDIHSGPSFTLLFIGIVHLVFVTVFGKEVDAYDRVSGMGQVQREGRNLPPIDAYMALLRRPLLLTNTFIFHNRIIYAIRRAFCSLACLLLGLLRATGCSPWWELIITLLVLIKVLDSAYRHAKRLGWLLLNNAVRDPSTQVRCDRAIRTVRMLPGVMQVQSSLFWEVSECELMALVRLRLSSSTDPAVAVREARQALENVVSYVFVDVQEVGDEDIPENEGCRHDICGEHQHSHLHSHSHSSNSQTCRKERMANDGMQLSDDNARFTTTAACAPLLSQPPKALTVHANQQELVRAVLSNLGNGAGRDSLPFQFVPPSSQKSTE
uniref:Uncharacterized protein n=1 Tax=Trypanosoma vivax (strain Y486) TaxID=1055687 RepID=G0U919_TRYVY|nr:conserved hypothetical protein [Trypanosoma vivax Y486]